MAKLPDMKKPFMLAFKTDAGKFRVFQILSWKVRSDFDLTIEPVACTCVMFRVESDCGHTPMIHDDALVWAHSKSDWLESDGVPDWRDEDTKKFVVIRDMDTEKNAIVHPDVGDLSLFNLMHLMTEGVTPKIGSTGGYLNPQRLYVECEVAAKHGVSINDEKVQSAGIAVVPVHTMDMPSDFDEDLRFPLEEVEEALSDASKARKSAVPSDVPEMVPVTPRGIPLWKKYKRPDPKVFYVAKDVWEQALYGMIAGKNVMLLGPSGSGKSELIYLVAKALGRNLEVFNMGAMSEPRTSLIGNTHFDKEKGTWFEMSRFARAVQAESGAILLDEMSRAERGAYNILLPLLDRQGYLALDESEDASVIKKGKGMSFFATANVGMEYTGTDALDKALKERFGITVDVFFPPPDSEIKVLQGRCGKLDGDTAKKLVDIAHTQRNLARNDGDFLEMISTRMLIEAGEQVAEGIPLKIASQFCIANHFSDEGGTESERTKINQIIQKGGF